MKPDSLHALSDQPQPQALAAAQPEGIAEGAAATAPPAIPNGVKPPSTKRRRKARRARPGWKATLVRVPTFEQLRAIQKSSFGLALDLSCLSDACMALALELGVQRIVERALLDLRTQNPADPGSLESATSRASPSSPSQLPTE